MPDNAMPDSQEAELRNAMLAAFGSDAMEWLDENDDATMASIEDKPSKSEAGLEDVLKQLSLTLEEGISENEQIDETNSRRVGKRNENATRYVVFEVGNLRFGIPLAGVQEIDRCGKITTLPRTPPWLRGITNLRGKIFSVTDFRKLLQLSDESPVSGEKIVVIQSPRLEMRTALVVDRVLGIRNLECKMDSAAMLTGSLSAFASGVSCEQSESTVLIETDRLLGCDDLRTFAV